MSVRCPHHKHNLGLTILRRIAKHTTILSPGKEFLRTVRTPGRNFLPVRVYTQVASTVLYTQRGIQSVHDGRVEESESAGVEKQKVLRARCGGADRLAAAAASQQAPAASTAGLTEPVAEVLERLCFLRAREKGRSGEAGCSSHGREGGV